MYNSGTARFKNKEAYLHWYQTLPREEAKKLLDTVKGLQPSNRKTGPGDCASTIFYTNESAKWCLGDDFIERQWTDNRAEHLKTIQEFLAMAETYQLPLQVGEWQENAYAFLYIGNTKKGIIVPEPERYLEYVPEVDYSGMSPAQVRSSLLLSPSDAQMEMIPAEANQMSVREVADQKAVYEDALSKAHKKMDDIKNAATDELSKLRAEIEKKQAELEAKKTAMIAELQEKMAEMEAMKENLENQIYLLDSQIYAIRCFAGEVVNFAKIRSGKNAPNDYPIVVHQKMHFLDEDLGRLASIYEIQWEEMHLFEELLKYDPTAFDTFTPNERCVSLVRISKDGTALGESQQMPFQNLLQKYEYYHGKTVGILIRNGENLYLGWTDEKRVHIEDDLILTPGKVDYTPDPMPESRFPSDEERWLRDQKAIRKKLIDGLISRSFVYNILQGIVEHTPILPLPAGVTLGRQSEYVVYSIADAWITDNRFGSFTEIIERCNQKVQKGDMVLTVQHLIAEHDFHRRWESWNNVRGRGDANRTHDVHADDCTIYPVNIVEYDEPAAMIRYKYPVRDPLQPKKEPIYYENTVRANNAKLSDEAVVLERYDYIARHVFISLHKQYSYTGEARANFEIYDGEYINLTYMNSVWLKWVITNKTLGGWTIKGKGVNYAYAIRYLKTALDHVRKREEREKELLDAVDPVVCTVPEWQVHLSEWKLENKVREITRYQAKRFAKYINERG